MSDQWIPAGVYSSAEEIDQATRARGTGEIRAISKKMMHGFNYKFVGVNPKLNRKLSYSKLYYYGTWKNTKQDWHSKRIRKRHLKKYHPIWMLFEFFDNVEIYYISMENFSDQERKIVERGLINDSQYDVINITDNEHNKVFSVSTRKDFYECLMEDARSLND